MRFRRLIPIFLLLAVILLGACAHPGTQTLPYPPAPPAALLDMLLADYRALGLPLPPPDAPLVRWELPNTRVRGLDGKVRRLSYLAFELPPAAGEAYPQLLIGTERFIPNPPFRSSPGTIVRVEPTAEAAEGVDGRYTDFSAFTLQPVNVTLGTAIQAKARGWDALAERLLDMTWKIELSGPGCHQGWGLSPRQWLAVVARTHFVNELIQPGSDWTAIVSRLDASVAFGGPTPMSLRWQGEPDPTNCTFGPLLHSLHLTVDRPRAAPSTIEAKIDALCDMGAKTSSSWHMLGDDGWRDFGTGEVWGDYRPPPAVRRVIELGFDAVPALIDHLTDERLTRSMYLPSAHNSNSFITLANIVREVLQRIAGSGAFCKWDYHCPITPAAARAWWTQAQAMGEEAYMLGHVLPTVDAREPNGTVLLILARKFPRRLEDAYRMALARPHMNTQSIADAIAASALPEAERRRLLVQGAEHPTPAHRSAALRALQSLEHKPDGGAR